jgi:hypothetical protein
MKRVFAVPELTRGADIKFDMRVSLRRSPRALKIEDEKATGLQSPKKKSLGFPESSRRSLRTIRRDPAAA